MVNFKENYHFSKFQRGSNFFQWGGGGGGGSNCLFPIETQITCDFPGGGVRTPCPPLDPHLLSRRNTRKSFRIDRGPIFQVTNLNRNLTQFRPSEIHCQPDPTEVV